MNSASQTALLDADEPVEQVALMPALQVNPDLVKTAAPSNQRRWTPDQMVLPWAEIDGDVATVHNIRNCTYRTIDDYDVAYYDRTFNVDDATTVDFIVTPFNDTPGIAHTMLSFGFADGRHVVLSVEIRKEQGEKYGPLKGFFRQYELMYVLADERDLFQKYANYYLCDVFLYRTKATPQQARELFLDVLNRTNKLKQQPEFYDTLANNCTTNIRNHINKLSPERVPYDYRVLLPGYSDLLAYELGLLESKGSFEETRRAARINYQAYRYRDAEDFSAQIRQ